MCYSAQIVAEYQAYVRKFGAQIGLKEFFDLFWRRAQEAYDILIPRGVEQAFENPSNEQERAIKALIDEYRAGQAVKFEQLLFEQKTRLTNAERKLLDKSTKATLNDQRVATQKIRWARDKLADLRRTEPKRSDSRIYPGVYAPVMVVQDGQRVVLPMRYHCLPAGRPAFFDKKYPGTYNARRDSLGGYWKGVFGVSHGVVLASAFY